MKQNQKQINDDMSQSIERTTFEPMEYFMHAQSFGFKFQWLESQDPNFAENIVEELNKQEK